MKDKLRFKLNKKTMVGVGIILLTALYLLITTVLAQSDTKRAGTGIDYNKDYLSYGDVWAFDSAAHGESNYRRNSDGTFSMHTSGSNTKNYTKYFYSTVTTNGYSDPSGTTMSTRAFNLFNNSLTRQATVDSPVEGLTIPVMEATANNALYSVVPDTAGDYYVYAYSENGAPTTMFYSILNSPEASNAHTGTGTVTTQLDFDEELGNNWYRAKITVDTVRWHAVALNCAQKTGSHTNVNNATGGKDIGTELSTTTYYNNWSTTPIYYNTVIIFKFASTNVKLGPVTKTGDSITINNPDTNRGNVTAHTIFGEEIEIGKAVTIPHCPVIISGEGIGANMLDEVKVETGSGQVEAAGKNYVYDFEDTSVISVSWTKLVNLPEITVTGGSSEVNMNFFGAKTAAITHPGGEEREYTFTVDFDGASDLASLEYSYTITGLDGNIKTVSGDLSEEDPSFSVSDVCYEKIEVTFTATDEEGDTFKATCTINLPAADTTAPFKVVSSYYWTWEEAVDAANAQSNANNKRVILNAYYTLPGDLRGNGMLENGEYVTVSGDRINYDLPSDVTFIVPYAESFNYNNVSNHPYACENQPITYEVGIIAVGSKVFVELTVPGNVSLGVSGVMAVGGTTDGACKIYDEHSNVRLAEGAEINVADKAILSTCGYIYGEGTVNAKAGSTVYMPFSVMDFRGGGYTVGAAGLLDTRYGMKPLSGEGDAISPFLRYTMNAIQCDQVIEQGATVKGYVDLVAQSEHNNTNAMIIGTSEGLIRTTNATIRISYDANMYASTYNMVGRTKLIIEGDASFGNLDLTVKTSLATARINTAKVNFPVPYNYEIEIKGGTFTVPNKLMLLPGASVTVNKGATLVVNNNAWLTVYDGLHDYTSSGNSSSHTYMEGYTSSNSNDLVTAPYVPYPSTAVLQGASFGGSGSADLIVNGTLDLQSGSIGGIIQTGDGGAVLKTAPGIQTSTKTQIGLTGSYSALIQSSYFAGATVRELQGEILDTGTGKRTKIVGGQTYSASEGTGNISSYTYTLYYTSRSTSASYTATLTDEVACILQGSWWNYAVDVHMILDGEETGTVTMYFAHGAALPNGYYYDANKSRVAASVTNEDDLYFIGEAEAKIVWADGSGETKYPSVRSAVQEAIHAGDRVVLLKNLTDFSSVIGPTADQDFIFDMNGMTINYRSTPFANNTGGKITIDVNHGTITNVVGNKHFDSPVLSLKEGCSLTLLLNGGTISITGDASTPLVNGGVENPGTLYIDLGGGTWEYRTGLVVPKASNDAGTQHNDLTVMAPYQSKAMFNNTGTLTITDSVGGAKVTTDLISNGTTLTAATPTTNFVSVIRNNAGATLYLGGGMFTLEPIEDEGGDPILSTAATPIPMAVYSAVILNFGDIQTCETGTALSLTGSGGYGLYNFIGGTVDLDLRGGTIKLVPYEAGVAANAAMYSGRAAVVNDSVMTLKDSTREGLILVELTTTSGNIYGVYTNTNSAFNAVLTLEGINIKTTQKLNNNCYGVYNGPGGTITSIKNCNIQVENGQALRNYGSNTNAALKAKIGDITGSTFIAGGAAVAANGVVGTHAFYNYYGDLGNISDSTFQSAGASALYNEASATVPISIGDITESHFDGVVYGLYTTYTTIGRISNSTFTGGTNYAMSVGTNSTIKSITGGKFATNKNLPEGLAVSTNSGGLNMAGTAENKSTGVKRVLATIGGITGVEFDVYQVGINISHADIGDLDHVIIKTQNGNGITASNGCIIGDITDCHITSGVYDEETGTFTTGAAGLSAAGAAATATADELIPVVGDIIRTTFVTKGNGITIAGANAGTAGKAAGSKVGDIVQCTFTTGAYGIAISGGTGNATGGAAAAPTVGDITGCNITAATYGISISGHPGVTNFPEHAFATVGDITGNTVNSGTIGIYLTYANAGKIEKCEMTATNPANTTGVIHIINLSDVDYIKDTNITIKDTSTTTSSGIYVSGSKVGYIYKCKITASKGYAITHTTTAALGVSTIGDIVGCTIKSGAAGIYGTSGQVTATAAGAAPVFGDIIDTTFETVTYGISIAGSAATANGAAVAPTVGDITGCTFNVGSYGISISGGAGVTAYPDHAFATVGDIVDTDVVAGTSYGIYLSYANAGMIDGCTVESAPTTNNYGVVHVTNRSSVKYINETYITVRDTSTNTTVAAIYTSASTIGDIIDCHITASKGPAISHNATAALGVSTIGNITDCTIKSGAGGIVGAGGAAAAATPNAAAPVIGDITKTTFDTVTYGISIGSAAANTYGVGAGAVVGKITGCTFDVGSYGIQIAGGAGTLAENFKDVGFAKVGDITGTTVNSVTYSIYLNYCKGGVIEDCKLNATSPAANSYVLGNANGSYIQHIKSTPIKVIAPAAKSYGIYNNGGQIDLIENSPIDAPYGIYNLNVRSSTSTQTSGEFVVYAGHIGTIRDMDVKVAQWALQNRGRIDEIVGTCSFVASNPSAQVPWDHGTIANSNAAANTVVNYNTWWGDQTLWRRTDTFDSEGNLTRTDEYKWDNEHMPTIGKISGDIKIIAENTSNNAAHGVAMINNGIIKEISGDVAIETYIHPDNAGLTTYSSYAIQNTSGGRIDKIIGNVKISAGANTIQNSTGQLYNVNKVTYKGGAATSGQETEIYRDYYHDYAGIGEITGNGDKGIVIEATLNNYAIANNARIGNITGKVSITADKGQYAISNTTGTAVNIEYTYTWPGLDPNAPKTYHEEFLMASMGVIGGEGSDVVISTANGYGVNNTGYIEAIIGVPIRTTIGTNNVPTILNAEGSYTVRDYTYTNLGWNEKNSWYDTNIERYYTYERPVIGEIRGVTVTTPVNYALRNAGDIASITSSSFTAGTGYGIDNTLSYAQAEGNNYSRYSVHYYHGASPLTATTQYWGEQNIWFTRDQAMIGKIDDVTITVTSGNYGIQNAGIINSITNSTIDVKTGSYAIGNSVRTATGEDVSKMKNYIYLNDSGNYAVTAAASITNKVWTYAAPTIESIGEGNTIQAVSQTIYNMGYIGEIGSAEGERTTITATGETANGAQYAIYNYRGLVTHQVRNGSTMTVDTNTGAQIDVIHNVSINSKNSVAIYNGDGTANALHPVIKEIGEGTEVTSVGANAVYNHATNAQIEKITGGIFTTGAGSFYALYNNSTTFHIEVSGGFFKGGADDRAHAIYLPNDTTRYTYPTEPEELVLSYGTKEVTFADGTTGTEYYFITPNVVYIHFEREGALEGTMDDLVIRLSKLEERYTVKNGFSWEYYSFKGWALESGYTDGIVLPDDWTGTAEALLELLERTDAMAGETINLYAIWEPDEIETYRIIWGEMNFLYTLPVYEWDAANTTYVQTNPGEEGWSAVENTNTITVMTGGAYSAVLTFVPDEAYGSLTMNFTDETGVVLEDGAFDISENEKIIVSAMLDGEPTGEITEKTPVGTITIVLTPITS